MMRLPYYAVPLGLILAGCAYNAPVAPATLNNSAVLALPVDAAWARTLQALSANGALVRTADRSQGLISTDKHAVRLTEQDADCGNIWGIPYLKDTRTTTDVAYAVYLQGDGAATRITVNTRIDGTFNAMASERSKQLSCTSLGALEAALIERIKGTR
jgi:uncharacterized lipoprotein